MSAATEAKADRLLAEGKVHRVDENRPRLFMVDASGGGQYRVVIGGETAWCDCPAGRRKACGADCSHVQACRKLFIEEHGTTALPGAVA
jgi:uncharacterized Zn finger protein